jgi:hypothetical protein
MHQNQIYGDAEPMSWRDIEALPFYLAGALAAFAIVHGLAESGPALQSSSIKAVVMMGMLGLYQLWSDIAPE